MDRRQNGGLMGMVMGMFVAVPMAGSGGMMVIVHAKLPERGNVLL